MLVTYTIVTTDGNVLYSGQCNEDQLDSACPEGYRLIEGVQGSKETHYLDLATDQLLEYTPYQANTKANPPSHPAVWDNSVMQWVDTRDIAVVRDEQWNVIKMARQAVITGGFWWNGSFFDSDATSQQFITGAAIEAFVAASFGQPYTRAWTLADNTIRHLSGQDCIEMARAMGAHIDAAHQTSRALRSAIYDPLATREQIQAISWPES